MLEYIALKLFKYLSNSDGVTSVEDPDNTQHDIALKSTLYWIKYAPQSEDRYNYVDAITKEFFLELDPQVSALFSNPPLKIIIVPTTKRPGGPGYDHLEHVYPTSFDSDITFGQYGFGAANGYIAWFKEGLLRCDYAILLHELCHCVHIRIMERRPQLAAKITNAYNISKDAYYEPVYRFSNEMEWLAISYTILLGIECKGGNRSGQNNTIAKLITYEPQTVQLISSIFGTKQIRYFQAQSGCSHPCPYST